ncbi:MAG: UxaA family hydrolase, partial [Anaerolineaceae bacterium]|nr:UxaA family hydrolase [Anaerolineaceae bacterium]
MHKVFEFAEIGRLAVPADNVGITTRRLEAGTTVIFDGRKFSLSNTILEGHRFALRPIGAGEALLSWGLPFGLAACDIPAGEYVINADTLGTLQGRNINFELPAAANFSDRISPYVLDEDTFLPAEQVPLYEQRGSFLGYRRPGGRGVGTRNTILLLGVTSHTAGYIHQLKTRLGDTGNYADIDGFAPVSHTEGGIDRANNLDALLRTLVGFIVHPNIAAALIVDYASDLLTNAMLRTYMFENHYPLDSVPHHFLSLEGDFEKDLQAGVKIVSDWLGAANTQPRSAEPLSHLKIALQCGGSDAFSGISGNPLASWVAKEVIRHGGAANLAETAELIGAEPYVLQKVKDIDTARQFLDVIREIKERAGWHGVSVEGNVTGGNKYRGLYNIVLKSIGAARKRHPDVRLDHVIKYAQPMSEPGFYFMDSPGNDLEGIAGQVAAGCNLVIFVTGNGSVTNFPFVPTIKIVTTTERYHLLASDMDVNAGLYLEGIPIEELGKQALALTLETASGKYTVGELAGHSQVQVWRNWQQTGEKHPEQPVISQRDGVGNILAGDEDVPVLHRRLSAIHTPNGYAAEQIGLILPTSLCSAQIARLAAEHLNRAGIGDQSELSRFVALPHTEGCGASSNTDHLFVQTMTGYITHPSVRLCLLLEHGCEKTHNDYMRRAVENFGIDPKSLGWASVQLDGGIQKVIRKVEAWFEE